MSTLWRWALAVVITLGTLVWQRMTGPTYPARGTVKLGGQAINMKLERSNTTASDQRVRVQVADPEVTGEVVWRRYPSSEPWQVLELKREGGELQAMLPSQPAAGKLEYQVRVRRGAEQAVFPERPAITRFRGDPPAAVLIPHILAMFVGMLFATRAGIEALAPRRDLRLLAWTTLGLFLLGGFVLGPLVQHYAFGQWWTGIPFGWDLTDNKTLLAALAWVFALWRLRGGRPARGATVAAALVTLVVFAIPHSAWGSQIDWGKIPIGRETPGANR
ncbi:MAG: hypothetical protein A2Y78_01530 [Acidobacteria bacterium RBG_13_68_16]|nr:MAG: hypothetical protein A2Y78_01530 [Acidobacteria bacterium RBG_13_68_16]